MVSGHKSWPLLWPRLFHSHPSPGGQVALAPWIEERGVSLTAQGGRRHLMSLWSRRSCSPRARRSSTQAGCSPPACCCPCCPCCGSRGSRWLSCSPDGDERGGTGTRARTRTRAEAARSGTGAGAGAGPRPQGPPQYTSDTAQYTLIPLCPRGYCFPDARAGLQT